MSADLQKGPRGGKLRLIVSHLDLARLPRPLMSPALAAAGAVDLDLDLQFSPARLQGSAAARALGNSVDAKFDLPASWPPTGRQGPARGAPLKLTLKTSEIDVAAVARTIAGVTGKKSSLDPRGKVQLGGDRRRKRRAPAGRRGARGAFPSGRRTGAGRAQRGACTGTMTGR